MAGVRCPKRADADTNLEASQSGIKRLRVSEPTAQRTLPLTSHPGFGWAVSAAPEASVEQPSHMLTCAHLPPHHINPPPPSHLLSPPPAVPPQHVEQNWPVRNQPELSVQPALSVQSALPVQHAGYVRQHRLRADGRLFSEQPLAVPPAGGWGGGAPGAPGGGVAPPGPAAARSPRESQCEYSDMNVLLNQLHLERVRAGARDEWCEAHDYDSADDEL